MASPGVEPEALRWDISVWRNELWHGFKILWIKRSQNCHCDILKEEVQIECMAAAFVILLRDGWVTEMTALPCNCVRPTSAFSFFSFGFCCREYRNDPLKSLQSTILGVFNPIKSTVVTICTTSLLCILPTQCICVFRMVLTINSDYFPKQH
jgi:hypothetical protein